MGIEMLAMATGKALVPQVVSGRALARKVASAPARLRGQAAASVRGRRRVTTTRLQATSSNGDTLGVIIVDHGSKKKDSNEMLDAFADLYKRKTGRDLVEVAHMELCEPSIETALTKCYSRGARDIVVAPYFLSPGRHIKQDIPRIVRNAAKKLPGREHRDCPTNRPGPSSRRGHREPSEDSK